MTTWLESILTAVLAFVSTNIDDLFVLMLLYGQQQNKPAQIMAGQYAGIGALVLLALAGSSLGQWVDIQYMGWLGFVPIYLGLRSFYQRYIKPSSTSEEAPAVRPQGLFAVAMITVANGGDNLGVYTPLLTVLSFSEKLVFVSVFVLMVWVWCRLALYLARHPWLATPLQRYADALVPIVLVLLGVSILISSGALKAII